jgi:hypothetical protein
VNELWYCNSCGEQNHEIDGECQYCDDESGERRDPDDVDYDEEYMREEMFADPGGRSALRAATDDNPRNLPCPTCHEENRLTPADVARGYQCDSCADLAESGGY